jgi:hypothetical protein
VIAGNTFVPAALVAAWKPVYEGDRLEGSRVLNSGGSSKWRAVRVLSLTRSLGPPLSPHEAWLANARELLAQVGRPDASAPPADEPTPPPPNALTADGAGAADAEAAKAARAAAARAEALVLIELAEAEMAEAHADAGLMAGRRQPELQTGGKPREAPAAPGDGAAYLY